MEETSKATVAGVLDIAAGICSLGGAVPLVAIALVGSGAIRYTVEPDLQGLAVLPLALFLPLAALTFAAGAVAVAGGVAALKRRNWMLAVTGSVAALFCFLPLGVAAIVLTILSEKEFQRPREAAG